MISHIYISIININVNTLWFCTQHHFLTQLYIKLSQSSNILCDGHHEGKFFAALIFWRFSVVERYLSWYILRCTYLVALTLLAPNSKQNIWWYERASTYRNILPFKVYLHVIFAAVQHVVSCDIYMNHKKG